jgi:GC-rich sequence DNA-binding factor
LQEDIKRTGEKYQYVQEIKGYMADLCDCLADKAALVEELEDQLQEFREERAEGDKARLQVRPNWNGVAHWCLCKGRVACGSGVGEYVSKNRLQLY